MARKKRHEEHENHERWLVSYADFITLLFAFFTSMYAISSVNAGKFKVLSESLAIAFNPGVYTSASKEGGPGYAPEQKLNFLSDFKSITQANHQKVLAALKAYGNDERVDLVIEDENVVIRISENMLFESGADRLLEQSIPLLDEIAEVLKELPNSVRVEGHTDDVPIHTERFPSNWDLSSARALTILKYFINENGFDPKRLSAVGYGEFRPLAANDTPGGRSRNRRIDIMIVKVEHDVRTR